MLTCGYMVIEENAYMSYSHNKYFVDLGTAYEYYNKLKKDIDTVYIISFQSMEF